MSRAVLLVVLLAGLVPGAAHAGVSEHTIVSGGVERSYRLYAPPGLDRSRSLPVVLVFHGYGQSVAGLVRLTGFDGEARREGFLAVYPYSVGLGWNAGDCCGGGPRLRVDDVEFVDDILADLRRRYRLDPRRTYATGISNGGIFSYYLACHRARTFAAIGPVAATMLPPCNPSRPVSVIHVHGLDDRVLPYEGGEGVRRIDWPSVESAIDFWRDEDRCGVPIVRRSGAATITSSRCAKGTAVRLIAIDGQGHGWPGEPIDTTATVWRFFEMHPRAAG